jgi:hypothetical protein
MSIEYVKIYFYRILFELFGGRVVAVDEEKRLMV